MLDLNSLEACRDRHQAMLKAAEHERLVRRALAGQPSQMAQMRNQLGALLSNLGQWLDSDAAMSGSGRLQSNA